MRFREDIPIYVQISNDIKEQIISGKLHSGGKIQSVREYSVFYEVTALTVQRAMQLLEADGVVQTKKGIGSFVVSDVQLTLKRKMVSTHVQEFIQRMGNMGITKETVLKLIQEAYVQ